MKTGSYNDDFYSGVYKDKSDSYYAMHRKKIETVMSFLDGVKAENILDIGCGDGFIAEMLSKKLSAKPFGLEISASAVKSAKKRGVDACIFDVSERIFPFEKEFFDVVFCGDIIEHIYNTEELLRNILNALKPGGLMIATVPNTASWYNRGFLLMGWLPTWVESASKVYTGNPFMKEGVGHIHAYTKKSLTELLKIMGFTGIMVKGSPLLGNGEYSKNQERLWNAVDTVLSKKASIASELVVRAKKPIKGQAQIYS